MEHPEISDFEINCLVAESLGWEVQREIMLGACGFTERYHQEYPNTIWAFRGGTPCGWEQYCFTATAEEALPIIFDNKIGLSPNEDGSYKAFTMLEGIMASECNSDNPLRAAMIEFLKIHKKI